MHGLPAQGQLLTALVSCLSKSPPADTSADIEDHRVLAILHAIYPGIVLPALDLLDRKLVTRLQVSAGLETERNSPEKTVAAQSLPANSENAVSVAVPATRLYTVRSLTSTLARRRHRISASRANTHIVHLDAWSCSCVGFVLDAFGHPAEGVGGPPLASQGTRQQSSSPTQQTWRVQTAPKKLQSISFGGTGVDGRVNSSDDIPCCKHLLACLLAEVWLHNGNGLTEKRTVTRQELAGILATS